MASNTKGIIFDLNGKPVPQLYNPTTDAYEPVQGQNGGPRATILGPDGTPVSSTNALPVQLTGSNPQDTKTPGIGDINSLHSAYNNATWDRWRNNTQGTLLASAARTTTTGSPTQTNYNAKGVLVVLDVTAASGTGGLQPTIRGLDPVTAKVCALTIAPTAITATGTYVFEIYPGSTGTGGVVTQRTSGVLPRTWVVNIQHGDASSYTYSVGYVLIL